MNTTYNTIDDVFGEGVANDIFWEEVNDLYEETAPVTNEEILNLDGHEVVVMYYDDGKTEAWVKGLGPVGTHYHWEGTTFEEFLEDVKENIKVRENEL